MPVWPVYVVHDNPSELAVSVAVDEKHVLRSAEPDWDVASDARRSYVTRLTVHRVHQQTFRTRVLRAYHRQCAICRLKHEELLDAAHIIPDLDPRGTPVVSNGLALCKIHHAAYDRHVLGITPDYVVEVRQDVLEEVDGPMLKHGLQAASGVKLLVPSAKTQQPRREFLEERYGQFRAAS